MKKNFKITITPRGARLCSMRVEEWEDGRWKLLDIFMIDSQDASSRLVLERENVKNGLYNLEIDDRRTRFMMV